MTNYVLASMFVLSFASISESFAACNGATATTAGIDEDGAYCGSWDCGATDSNVTCTLSKGTLTISGEGAMKDYGHTASNTAYPKKYKTNAPWGGTVVTKANIIGNVTKIGESTFLGESYLTEITGTESLKTIGMWSFEKTSLKSIDIPNVTTIDWAAFYDVVDLKYINMRDDVYFGDTLRYGWSQGNLKSWAFGNINIINSCVSNPETGMKTCGSCGDKYVKSGTGCVAEEDCKDGYTIDRENKMCNKIAGCASFADGACTCDKYYYKKEGGCVSFEEGCGSGWLEKNRECIEASEGCGDGYKDLGGWCNRVIYTPAEAAEVLNDNNTNFITITFRK